MSAQPYEHLSVDRRANGIVVVSLAYPERRNAMSAPMTASWGRVIRELREDRSLRCLMVTGEGTAFCSGGDVGWIGSEPDAGVAALRERMLPFYRTWLSVRDLEVPTIAAINGPAIGAGVCLAMACDLRYATEEASLSVPFTALGLHAGMAATWLLPAATGLPVARELLLTGRKVSGLEAQSLGLVNRAFPAERFPAEVDAIASAIAATAPIATRLTKVALASGGHAGFEAALQWEALAQPITLATADLQEGLAAQRERRRPVFRGA